MKDTGFPLRGQPFQAGKGMGGGGGAVNPTFYEKKLSSLAFCMFSFHFQVRSHDIVGCVTMAGRCGIVWEEIYSTVIAQNLTLDVAAKGEV